MSKTAIEQLETKADSQLPHQELFKRRHSR
jgi:hypothetical protein